MKKFVLAGIFGLLMAFATTAFTTSAFADDRNFTIVNATGYAIKFVGVNPPGDNVYNENELSSVLNDGAQFAVKFTGSDKGCVWNIKVTWADDNSSSFFKGLDLCQITTVTLKYDKATDTASYISN